MTHNHHHNPRSPTPFVKAGIVIIIFAAVEFFSGLWAKSLALISDSGHMLADALALGIGAFAAWLAQKPISNQHTFGLNRAEVIAGSISSLILLVLTIFIIAEAAYRLFEPVDHIKSSVMIVVAIIGLITNIIAAIIMHGAAQTLNSRAAILHILGDMLASLMTLVAGIVIFYTNWLAIDPILSIFIALLICYAALRLVRESVHILMEATPKHISLSQVATTMTQVEGVKAVHDLHIWHLDSHNIMLTAHVELTTYASWHSCLPVICQKLNDQYGINHVTLQPEAFEHPLEPFHNRA